MKEIGSEFEIFINYKELYVTDLIWIFGGIKRRARDEIKNRIKKDPELIIKLSDKYGHPLHEEDLYFYQNGLMKLTNEFIDVKIVSMEGGSIRSKLIVGIPTYLLAAGATTALSGDPRLLIPVGLVIYIITEIAEELSEEIDQRIMDWIEKIPQKSKEKGKENQEILIDYKRWQ